MNRKRTSVVWNLPKEEFSLIVKNSATLVAIARAIGACAAAGTYPIIKKRLKEDGVDYSHIQLGLNNNIGKKFPGKAVSLDSVMVENSTYSRTNLKVRLLKAGILKNQCELCGLGSIWNDKPISMRLDHINGISNDHRRHNLRMICPNCDSQLDTYCRKNCKTQREKRARWRCDECGGTISRRSNKCRKCNHKSRISNMPTKIEWPSDVDLSVMLADSNKNAVSKKLGVSWQALDKRIKIHKIKV